MEENKLPGERSNETIKQMKKNQDKNTPIFRRWYLQLFAETNYQVYYNKQENMGSCFTVQGWDWYPENGILDNTHHSRCRNRFCINCQILNNSLYTHNLMPVLNDLTNQGYIPYFLTLTVPNCAIDETSLDIILKKMSKSYQKLFQKLNADDKRAFKGRYLKIHGSIRVLEIAVNKVKNEFHPHYHILILLKPSPEEEMYLRQNIRGRYSYNKNEYNMQSLFSIQIMKMWSMIWYEETITEKKLNSWSSDPSYVFRNSDGVIEECNLEINLQVFKNKKVVNGEELTNVQAFYELLKYTVEFDSISSYDIFKALEVQLLYKKRIQCAGILKDALKEITEENPETIGEVAPLVLPKNKKEVPKRLITWNLKELYTIHGEMKKLYRKNNSYDKEFYKYSINQLN